MSSKQYATPTNLLNHNKSRTAKQGIFSMFPPQKSVVEPFAVSVERKKELLVFCRNAKIKFLDISFLHMAFLHRSVSNENGAKCNNERLEFVGDSILGCVTAFLLYDMLPG